ncbi:MAG: HAD family hydrolase [Polyangiales bacterium]
MPVLDPSAFSAVLFDLDGVLTDTARLHRQAWKQAFDAFLEWRAAGGPWQPFDADLDYHAYVDGKLRDDGVQAFLQARGLSLPLGDLNAPASLTSVRGLSAHKNALFVERLERDGVEVYESSTALLRQLRAAGLRTAVVSSSKNCLQVLRSVGIDALFEVRVDGVVAGERALAGKPDPATFLAAAAELGVPPKAGIVVEDARAGVEAGRRGAFGLVIGIDRQSCPEALRAAGADWVVSDLAEVRLKEGCDAAP